MLNLVNIGGSGGGTDEILKTRSSLKIRFTAAASFRMFPADGESVWVKVATGQKTESGALHFETTFKLIKLD